mgnify:CR=1 FL=1
MNTKDISLSIYSFGYGAGFIKDERVIRAEPFIDLPKLVEMADAASMGGIEFPVDYFFGDDFADLNAFIESLEKINLAARLDIDTFEPDYVRNLLPVIAKRNISFVRIKMSNLFGGNRYKQGSFREVYVDFVEKLHAVLPSLGEHGIKLLIENHQDLSADELVQIINETSAELVGVNWDIGNSLPTGDTPEGFLQKTKPFIGNVHIKDYKLYRRGDGYSLCRCAIGDGVVNFENLFSALEPKTPMSIELGAQVTRVSDVFKSEFWENHQAVPVAEKASFFKFLVDNLHHNKEGETLWERNCSGKEIMANEMQEFEHSLQYLSTLNW